MTQYAIVTDLNKCTGCLACGTACKTINNVPIGAYWNKVLRIGPNAAPATPRSPLGAELYFLPVQCQHCQNPACVSVCPTEASTKREDGTVQINKEKCIGCQFCVMSCPYGVRYLNAEEKVVEKCTLCEQLTVQGDLPQCVNLCGSRARFFGDIDKGIESMECPGGIYVNSHVSDYEDQHKNRQTILEQARPFADGDVYMLPDVGNHPSFRYILRKKTWHV